MKEDISCSIRFRSQGCRQFGIHLLNQVLKIKRDAGELYKFSSGCGDSSRFSSFCTPRGRDIITEALWFYALHCRFWRRFVLDTQNLTHHWPGAVNTWNHSSTEISMLISTKLSDNKFYLRRIGLNEFLISSSNTNQSRMWRLLPAVERRVESQNNYSADRWGWGKGTTKIVTRVLVWDGEPKGTTAEIKVPGVGLTTRWLFGGF